MHALFEDMDHVTSYQAGKLSLSTPVQHSWVCAAADQRFHCRQVGLSCGRQEVGKSQVASVIRLTGCSVQFSSNCASFHCCKPFPVLNALTCGNVQRPPPVIVTCTTQQAWTGSARSLSVPSRDQQMG